MNMTQHTNAVVKRRHDRQRSETHVPFQRRTNAQVVNSPTIDSSANRTGPNTPKIPDVLEDDEDRRRRQEHGERSEQTISRSSSRSMKNHSMEGSPMYKCDSLIERWRDVTERWNPMVVDPLEMTDDPWLLPPISELASLGSSAG